MNAEPSLSQRAPNLLSWSACIPTLNRFDVLQINVRCLLVQTRLPKQVIIVDASPEVERHRSKLVEMFAGTGVDLIVEPAEARSSAVQRNQGLRSVSADVVVFMDDDSLLFPNCAERFLEILENDPDEIIVGLGLQNIDSLPPVAQPLLEATSSSKQQTNIEQKKDGTTANLSLLNSLEKYRLWRFFRREILMQAMERMFVPYDHRRHRPNGAMPSNNQDLMRIRHLPGYGMVVRTHVARAEPFNPFLLAYCPFEDLDASYRYGRHGLCAYAAGARLKHFEVEGSRITRLQATSLGVSNVAFFVHTNSDSHLRHRALFAIYMLRRLIGETLKDLMTRRLDFPQARGVLSAIPRSFGIFKRTLPDAQEWYLEQQREFLKRGKPF